MQYHVITQTPELEARNKTPFLDPENKTNCHSKTKSSENQAPLHTKKEETQLIYVNSKQYHRIMVRRLARAKLLASGRISDKRSKFLHQSRSKHALNRYRGVGGKFYSVWNLGLASPKTNPTALTFSIICKGYDSLQEVLWQVEVINWELDDYEVTENKLPKCELDKMLKTEI